MTTVEYEDKYHQGVKCHVRSLEYDFWTGKGVLWMAWGHCVDMSGCIKLFLAIDPDCQFITTMSGEEMDTRYIRRGSDWKAVPHR